MTEQQHLTHIDEKGDVRMVDVSEKDITKRVAVAEGFISCLLYTSPSPRDRG